MQQLPLDSIDSVTISGGNRLPMTLFSRYALEPTKLCVANRMVGLLTATQESKSWRKEVLTSTHFPGRLFGNGSRMVQRARPLPKDDARTAASMVQSITVLVVHVRPRHV